MNILKISAVDLSDQSGAVDHFVGVANGLSEVGARVTVVACEKQSNYPQRLAAAVTAHKVNVAGKGVYASLAALSDKALEVLSSQPFDAVYLRTFPLDYLFLARHFEGLRVKAVCELNTKTGPEYRSKGKALRGRVYEFFEGRTLASCRGWLPVTQEIQTYAAQISRTQKPFIIAKNGVDFSALGGPQARSSRERIRQQLGAGSDQLVMVMLGFNRPWHGYERAVQMLSSMPKAQLWLIGSSGSGDEAAVETVARAQGVADRVKVLPWMKPGEAAPYVAAADLGLSALAIDLKDLGEAQPMKVATYLYMGLPVLTNYQDLRLDNSLPFVFHTPSNDPRVLAQVALELNPSDDLRRQAHRFATDNLSWRSVGQETLDFLRQI
ncbi:MAG: glycosyltransferase family 4 protein [Meiothermus sp.]|nr:glycosyltransferase family 4 protein [Meiothermus sp.]